MSTDQEQIKEQVAARTAEEVAGDPAVTDQVIDSDFLWQCYHADEVGDGLLYCALHRGKFVHNCQTKGEWYKFNGVYWEMDNNGRAISAVENVVKLYLQEIIKLDADLATAKNNQKDKNVIGALEGKIKSLKSRCKRLRKNTGRKNCLEAAATSVQPLTCVYEDLDRDPMLLACANGVIDLRTGKLRPGRPEDYITKACPVEFHGIDTPAETWENYLYECLEDQEKINFIHKLMGYAITGLDTLRIFPVFWGPHGQNGKGTFMKLAYRVLGEYSGPIQSEMLIAQRNGRSASGPSPDIMALKGKRFVWGSETEEGQRFAAAKVKLLTGGDPLVGRNPNDRYQTTFDPSHSLFLVTNERPHAPPQDNAFWSRCRIITFPYSFVINHADDYTLQKHEKHGDELLEQKLMENPAAILGWFVKGCLLWQKEGLKTPKSIESETAAYRRDEDQIQDFIDECCLVDENMRAGSTDLYEIFKPWWTKNVPKSKPLSIRKFGDLMTVKFEKSKPKGLVVYMGVGIKDNIHDKYEPLE